MLGEVQGQVPAAPTRSSSRRHSGQQSRGLLSQCELHNPDSLVDTSSFFNRTFLVFFLGPGGEMFGIREQCVISPFVCCEKLRILAGKRLCSASAHTGDVEKTL